MKKVPPAGDGSKVWHWLKLLKTDKEEDLDILRQNHPELLEPVAILKELSADELLREEQRAYERACWDEAAMLRVAEEKGRAEGEARGRAEGEARGLAEGEARGEVTADALWEKVEETIRVLEGEPAHWQRSYSWKFFGALVMCELRQRLLERFAGLMPELKVMLAEQYIKKHLTKRAS